MLCCWKTARLLKRWNTHSFLVISASLPVSAPSRDWRSSEWPPRSARTPRRLQTSPSFVVVWTAQEMSARHEKRWFGARKKVQEKERQRGRCCSLTTSTVNTWQLFYFYTTAESSSDPPWESARSPQTKSAGLALCSSSSAPPAPPPVPSGGSELCAQLLADSALSPGESAEPSLSQALLNLLCAPFALRKCFIHLYDIRLTALHTGDELGEGTHGSICLALSCSLNDTTHQSFHVIKRIFHLISQPASKCSLLLCAWGYLVMRCGEPVSLLEILVFPPLSSPSRGGDPSAPSQRYPTGTRGDR